MAKTPLGAINAWFSSSLVATSLPGGFWTGIAPEATLPPYATVNLVASSPTWTQSDDYFQTDHVRISFFAESAEVARSIGESFRREFGDHPELVIDGRSLIYCRMDNRTLVVDQRDWLEVDDRWQMCLKYSIITNRKL